MSYYDYSTTASSNSTIEGINIAEGCQAGNLNDAIRASMSHTAAYLADVGGALDTAGTANTYTVTTSQTLTLSDGLHLWVRINVTNTGASTINVDGTGARSIKRFSGGSAADMAAGDLAAGSLLFLSYDSANGYFLASGFMPATQVLTGDIQFTTGSNTATAGHIDYPDVTSADVDLFVFGAGTNTSGTVEFTICGASGSDTDKKHSFFDNSALISRGGGSTGFGRTSGGSYTVDVYNATADYIARFESGDANAFVLFQDSSTTAAGHVRIGAVGNEYHVYSNNVLTVEADGSTYQVNLPIETVSSASGIVDTITVNNFTGDGSRIRSGRALAIAADYDNNSGTGQSYVSVETDGSEALRVDASQNLLLNTTTSPATGGGVLVIGNRTAVPDSVADASILFAADISSSSELRTKDEAGNVTTLSPHNFSLIPGGPSEDMAWSYYSEREGKAVNCDIMAVIRAVEALTGKKFIFTEGE